MKKYYNEHPYVHVLFLDENLLNYLSILFLPFLIVFVFVGNQFSLCINVEVAVKKVTLERVCLETIFKNEKTKSATKLLKFVFKIHPHAHPKHLIKTFIICIDYV